MFEKQIHKVRMNQNKFCLNKKMPMEKTFLPNIKTLVKCEVLFHSLSNDLKKNITSSFSQTVSSSVSTKTLVSVTNW